MKPTGRLSVVAIALSLLALVVALSGGAYAAAKIGKNQVVTKSIKNGAVTTPKLAPGAVTGAVVANGSLTAADLAVGTIPAAVSGESVVMANTAAAPSAPNGGSAIAPSGPTGTGQSYVGIAPVRMQVANLAANTSPQGIGQAVQVQIEAGPALGAGVPVLSCTIGAGMSNCANPATAVINAGDLYFIRIINGPGGAGGGYLTVGYTVRVP